MKRDLLIWIVIGVSWVVTGGMYVNHQLKMDSTEVNVASNKVIIDELYARSADRWTATDQRSWCIELKRLNPNLVLPKISK